MFKQLTKFKHAIIQKYLTKTQAIRFQITRIEIMGQLKKEIVDCENNIHRLKQKYDNNIFAIFHTTPTLAEIFFRQNLVYLKQLREQSDKKATALIKLKYWERNDSLYLKKH